MKEQEQNLIDILKVIYRRRKFIITVCFIVGLGTAAISLLFLKNYFKATTIFYPASPALVDPNRVYGTSNDGIEYFGSEDEVDQLLTAANSNQLLDSIVAEFDLYTHYKINPDKPKAKHKVRKRLLKLYDVIKNENGAIELSVEDKDKERAAAMANRIRERVNTIHQNFLRANQYSLIQALEATLQQRNQRLQDMSDSLRIYRERYNVYDVKAQSEFLARYVLRTQNRLEGSKAKLAYFKTINRQDSVRKYNAEVNMLTKQAEILAQGDGKGNMVNLKDFNAGKDKISSLEEQSELLYETITEQQEVYAQYKAIYEANVSSIMGVEEADVPVVKSRPSRTLIVLGAGLIAFIFCVMGILIFDQYKDIKWKEVFSDK